MENKLTFPHASIKPVLFCPICHLIRWLFIIVNRCGKKKKTYSLWWYIVFIHFHIILGDRPSNLQIHSLKNLFNKLCMKWLYYIRINKLLIQLFLDWCCSVLLYPSSFSMYYDKSYRFQQNLHPLTIFSRDGRLWCCR